MKPTHEELVAMRGSSKKFKIITENPAFPIENLSLDEALKVSHARHTRGEKPGIIAQLENEFELDLIAMQKLWSQMGLPT